MNINLLLTCYKNELFSFLLSAPSLPKEMDLHNFSLFKKNKSEPLGFSDSASSLKMFLIEIIIVEVTKNLQLFCTRYLVLGLNFLMLSVKVFSVCPRALFF